jgi:hypothetical protein
MIKYEIIETESSKIVKKTELDGKQWFIPMDEENSDYIAYLKYKDETPVSPSA